MKEEILNMPVGTDLNVLIAIKLFNGHIITKSSKLSDKTFYALVGGENEEYQPLEKSRNLANVWWRHAESEAWEACPDYSTDISAAWDVVEKLKGNGEFDLYWFNDHWSCWFGKNEAVNASTAPEAICKAALLAVMEVTK